MVLNDKKLTKKSGRVVNVKVSKNLLIKRVRVYEHGTHFLKNQTGKNVLTKNLHPLKNHNSN